MSEETTPDPVMEAVAAAVTQGRAGDVATARDALLATWQNVGPTGDAFHRCTVAHYLADLHDDPAEALIWDVRALDAADALTDRRAQEHHADLRVAGFYPSLHLNLADNFRRLGSFGAAGRHLGRARQHAQHLDDGPYGDSIRAAMSAVESATAERDTSPLAERA